ncbi:MAG: hypothetical protein V2A79_02735 [Planctomycetota bacterium]
MVEGVKVVARSENAKLGRCAATYVSQATCPDSCPFRGQGCYAESGPIAWAATSKVNGSKIRPYGLARQEAREIDRLPADRPLRVHVVGDCRTDGAARVVSGAMARYARRGQTVAWTYTHAWRQIRKASWGKASVLASVEAVKDIRAARARGYAAAVVVAEHVSERPYVVDGEKILACPAESGKTDCARCRLCTRTDWLKRNRISIGFAAHGTRKGTVRKLIQADR